MRKILVLALLLALTGCGGPTVGVGQEGHLISGAQQVAVAVDADAFSAFNKAVVANDKIGAGQLVVTGRVFTVPANTRVLVLEPGSVSTRVRILDGGHTGQSGLVPSEYVKP